MLNQLISFARFAGGLGEFLRQPLSALEARRRIQRQLDARGAAFLSVVERGIFGNARSPYLALLRHASVGLQDIVRSVQRGGIEQTLAELYDAGIHVTLDEFKGRRAIERLGLHLPVKAEDFDNPLLARHYQAVTGGSRSRGDRILIDLDLLAHEAAYHSVFLEAFGLSDRPFGLWRPLPPGVSGMKTILRHAKLGKPIEKWFHQNRIAGGAAGLKFRLFTACTIYGGRLAGCSLPLPCYVPAQRSDIVARWLARKCIDGRPAILDASASSAVRVCLAASKARLDIRGSFFRCGGEPYTPGKTQVIADAGCRASSHYAMSELGRIGLGCACPSALDDVHLLTDKVEVLQRQRSIGGAAPVGALFLTTILPACPKLMLNVETADYAVVEQRHCGCPIGELGFTTHLHTIRSYEKLTSEGMSFLGSDLITLLEEILPRRFGGNPMDYQFLEEEEDGLPKVSLLVSPRVGAVDERVLIEMVLSTLGKGRDSTQMMSRIWRDGRTLRIIRREPTETGGAKIQPLHVMRTR